jgi:hypothetical protein
MDQKTFEKLTLRYEALVNCEIVPYLKSAYRCFTEMQNARKVSPLRLGFARRQLFRP